MENGWAKTGEDEMQIRFQRNSGAGQLLFLAIWPVELAPAYWSWTRVQHVERYFEHERKEPRPPNIKWSGFKASERLIGGGKYPALNFHTKGTSDVLGKYETNGIFLLIFPADFETRHRFYVAMWEEVFKPGKSFALRADLHDIVRKRRTNTVE